ELDDDAEPATVGDHRTVRALVALGELTPDDVSVQLVHGRVRADGTLQDAIVQRLELAGEDAGGRFLYRGGFDCCEAGEYGLTVRVVPDHPDLQSWADTGLVSWADPERLGSGAGT